MAVITGFVPTPEGHAALQAAAAEARRREVPLVVANVARAGAHVDEDLAPEPQLAALQEELRGEGLDVEVVQQRDAKDVTEGLLALAAERSADLLVIGLRRRTAVGKLLLGSTAQRILLEADCPVLAVKA